MIDMKQFYKWTWIGFAAMLFCACQKEDGYAEEPEVESYTSAGQVVTAINSLYGQGAPTFYGERFSSEIPAAAVGGYLTGFFENQSTRSSALYDHCSGLTFTADNIAGYLDHVWSRSYEAIRISNEVIGRTVGTPGLSAEEQSELVAEARFFRAYNYFYLAKAFGAVPVVTDYRHSDDGVAVSGLSSVYALITSDLRLAVSYLAEMPSEDNTRINRAVAQTLLADVYLTMSGYPLKQNHYKQAAEMARSVIRSGRYSLLVNGITEDVSTYNTLMANGVNEECLYRYNAASSGSMAALCLPDESSEWGVVKRTARNMYQPTEAFLTFYDPAQDLRAQERQFFHSFLKYERNGRTIIQTYSPLSYLWFDENALLGTGSSRGGTILYRYAEVLLIAAEAIAAAEDVTQEAVDYLTQVRARAYPDKDAVEIASELASLSSDAFIAEVWTERLREFALEMKAWPDIQRTCKFPERLSTGEGTVIVFKDAIGSTSLAGAVFKEENLLFPRPSASNLNVGD